jgi:GT2 family glycosyltransferase
MIVFRIPDEVKPVSTHKQPIISTRSGGRIAIDHTLLSIWKAADGRELNDLTKDFAAGRYNPEHVRIALACLVEAGLLEIENLENCSSHAPVQPHSAGEDLVSVVIVSYNSRSWLEACLPSLMLQSYKPIEIIVIDNASQDGTVQWVAQTFPSITLIKLERLHSLAHALNLGLKAACGKFALLLNPDTELDQQALAELVLVAKANPNCAAVAAKLKFIWAPAFLNGIGNYVGAFSWGTDYALGHLDLGQFDDQGEIPSACFAAALVPKTAWEAIGPIDEGFPLYYEDSEWCYRARLYGYSTYAAPRAIVYHAFSGRVPSGEKSEMSVDKLQRVVYGRLRFATKLLNNGFLIRFLFNYILEDIARFSLTVVTGNWRFSRAYLRAWGEYRKSITNLKDERKLVQKRRIVTDGELFGLQRDIPAPLMRNGLPLLTWDLIVYQYLPLFASGQTREIPGFSDILPDQHNEIGKPSLRSLWRRSIQILHSEGLSGLMHRIGKSVQWRLMRP